MFWNKYKDECKALRAENAKLREQWEHVVKKYDELTGIVKDREDRIRELGSKQAMLETRVIQLQDELMHATMTEEEQRHQEEMRKQWDELLAYTGMSKERRDG